MTIVATGPPFKFECAMQREMEIDGIRLHLSQPHTIDSPWIGQGEILKQLLACWMVVGEKDPIVRGADLKGFEGHADDMVVERVPGAGHFLPEERPRLIADRVSGLFPARRPVAI